MLKHCPDNCGRKTFCFKGQPLPEDKTNCYSQAVVCLECGLPYAYLDKEGYIHYIPTPTNTKQYWKDKVCEGLGTH